MTLQGFQFGFRFNHLYFSENAESGKCSAVSNAAVVFSRLTHALSQRGLGKSVARLMDTKTAHLAPVREVNKRKPAFGHARTQSD
jgi:hypothetical protein